MLIYFEINSERRNTTVIDILSLSTRLNDTSNLLKMNTLIFQFSQEKSHFSHRNHKAKTFPKKKKLSSHDQEFISLSV